MNTFRPCLSSLLVVLLLAPGAGLAGQTDTPAASTQENAQEAPPEPFYTPSAPPVRKRLQPTLAFSSRGARVGLGGTF